MTSYRACAPDAHCRTPTLIPLLYNVVLLLGSPLLALYLAYRLWIKGKSREGFRERLGLAPRLGPPPPEGRVWLHAVSAGEVVAAAAIVRQMRTGSRVPEVVISSTTPAGHQQARKLIPEARAHFYFPFDFLPCAWLALARVRPTAVAAVETEIWPNWLWLARCLGIRSALVNGQFADRGFSGARKARFLYRWALGMLDRLWMQSQLAAERALYLGAPPDRLRVVGNVKFDQELPAPRPEAVEALQTTFGVNPGRVWIAGSTHPGEEEQVLFAFKQLREPYPDLKLLLAPRHIQRAAEVQALVEADGWTVTRRSRPESRADVLLLDTMGDLSALYAFGDVVFVGGSLISIGGHDILQPLFHGKPTLFGPHMHNQRDIAALALQAGAVLQVRDAGELAAAVERCLGDEETQQSLREGAERLLSENTGAARECAELLARLASGELPPTPAGADRPHGGLRMMNLHG